jgi:uncharacterized membrane protein
MTVEFFILFTVSIACDVFGQLAFKLGTRTLSDMDGAGITGFIRELLAQRWIVVGLVIYTVELLVWIRILAIAPLTLAFPLASLNILGIVLVGRTFLGETVSLKQWTGAALITIGTAIVAQTFPI